MSHVFHSKFSAKVRLASIISSENIVFEPTQVIEDVNNCYVIVSGLLQNLLVVLLSIYAPNWDE